MMNRISHTQETSRRVVYFLCHLERCGDEDFVSRLPPSRPEIDLEDDSEELDRTLLFSTN